MISSNLIILYKVLLMKLRKRSRTGFFSGIRNAINPGAAVKACTSGRTRKIHSSTYVTIVLICLSFIVCYCPLYVIAGTGNHHQPTEPWLGLVAIELLSLNVLANPLVYTLSNMRFRRYVRGLLTCDKQEEKATHARRNSGESSFNETISRFFSTATTARRLSNTRGLRSGNSGSRISLQSSRLGVVSRQNSVDTVSSTLTISRPRTGSNSARKVSTISCMPHLQEDHNSLFKPRSCESLSFTREGFKRSVSTTDIKGRGLEAPGHQGMVRFNSLTYCSSDGLLTANIPTHNNTRHRDSDHELQLYDPLFPITKSVHRVSTDSSSSYKKRRRRNDVASRSDNRSNTFLDKNTPNGHVGSIQSRFCRIEIETTVSSPISCSTEVRTEYTAGNGATNGTVFVTNNLDVVVHREFR